MSKKVKKNTKLRVDDEMKGNTARLVFDTLKESSLIVAVMGAISCLVWGTHIFFSLCTGFMLGCTNFIILSFGIQLLMQKKPKYTAIIHFATFAARYLLVGFVFFELVKHEYSNIFALVLGFIVVYAGITLSALKKSKSADLGGNICDGRS